MENVLLFFASAIALLLLVTFTVRKVRSSGAEKTIARFLRDVETMQPARIGNVRLSYVVNGGAVLTVTPFLRGDLYVAENFLAVVRYEQLFFRAYFSPLLITFGPQQIQARFPYLDVFRPEKIGFKSYRQSELEIVLRDPQNAGVRHELTCRGLSESDRSTLKRFLETNRVAAS